MTENEPIHAASLWYGDESAMRLDRGKLSEIEDGWDLRIPATHWADSELPVDVEDWAILVTRQDGEHLSSEVANHYRTPAAHRLKFHTDPITIIP